MNYPALAYWASVKDEEKQKKKEERGKRKEGGMILFIPHPLSFILGFLPRLLLSTSHLLY